MRLLNTTTKELIEFQGNLPAYAILSHVWKKEEVTFQDIADLTKAKKMQGFAKIVGACNTAIMDGFEYIWIDTCCINKESSAELSEAINSMYAWYKNARACYAYLSDVPSKGDHNDPHSLFAMSLWFTRGWTLQELIAPLRVIFYGVDWVDIGTKATLQETISAVTGISTEVIVGKTILDDVPVAVRMSWAADRKTTRVEDIAYGLMGLFGINMPLLYGEGRKAFIRLQHEIIKRSNDHSIFAWTSTGSGYRGMLARSPNEFRDSDKVERISSFYPSSNQPDDAGDTPYSITNKGLHIVLPTMGAFRDGKHQTLAFLNCGFSGQLEPIAITLLRVQFLQSSEYVRPVTRLLGSTELGLGPRGVPAQRSSLYIADDYSTDDNNLEGSESGLLLLKVKVPTRYGKPRIKSFNCEETVKNRGEWICSIASPQGAILVFEEPQRRERFAVIVGIWKTEVMWCDILTDPKDEDGLNILNSRRSTSFIRLKRKERFLDRASADLAHGWSVTVSPATSNVTSSSTGMKFKSYAEVEIKKSPRQRNLVPLLKRPDGRVGCLVTPPGPEHGFAVDVNNLRQSSSVGDWVQRLGSFILYMERGDSKAARVLTFKSNGDSEEEFSLLVECWDHTGVCSGIENRRPENVKQALINNRNRFNNDYSVVLEQGKLVFVTIRQCRDASAVDFVIKLSM